MKDDDLLYVVPAIGASVLAEITTKGYYSPLFASRESVFRSYKEGLYHITSDDAADKIIESQELHASSRFTSYGIHKRCFFFGGVPDFENVCVNVTPGQTLTAVRVMLPYERLAEFDRRSLNDGAITYKGNLSLEGAKVEKVRLGLKERDGELYYSEISEEEYQNYKLNLSEDKMKIINNKLAFKLRTYLSAIRMEYDILKGKAGEAIHELIHDESSGMRIFPKTRKDYIEENRDLFENTAEIPVQDIIDQAEEVSVRNITDEEKVMQMFSSIMDANNQSYQVGSIVFTDKNDVKAELLKGVVASVVTSIQDGVTLKQDTVIKPGMSSKDMMDVLYINLCNVKVDECYNLLDNASILFSVCQGYVQNKNNESIRGISTDPRIQFLNQDIDNFNSNLKQNNMGQVSY